jgi:hypothetical protein
MLEPAHSTVQ